MPFNTRGHRTFDPDRFSASDRARAAARSAAGRQTAAFVRASRRPEVRREPLDSIVGRRVANPGLTPLRVLDPEANQDYLVARDEILIRQRDLSGPRRRALDQRGFVAEPIPELGNLVARFVRPEATPTDVDELLEALGGVASYSHVTPCGMNTKRTGAIPEVAPEEGPDRPTPQPVAAPVRVAVLDTGVTPEVRADHWLAGLQKSGHVDPLNELPRPIPDRYLDFGAGHGTFVAGILQQLAPDADLVVRRVLDSDGVATEVEVAVALVRAVKDLLVDNGRLIVNLSCGTETVDDKPPIALEAAVKTVKDHAKTLKAAELMLVAAAGNEGRDRPVYPAAIDGVVAVAACNRPSSADSQPTVGADWSTRGAWVMCSTIADGILSTFVPGTEPAQPGFPEQTFGTDSWGLWTGTSFAAPQVAGAVAYAAGNAVGLSLENALKQLLAGQPTAKGYGALVQIIP